MPEIDRQTREAIVAAALAAPSAENFHHVEMRWAEPATLCIVGPRVPDGECAANARVLSLIGMGAMQTNVTIQAAALGFTPRSRLVEDNGRVGELQFEFGRADQAIGREAATVLFDRHTNRRLYHGPGLPEARKRALEEGAASGGKTGLSWIESAQRSRLLAMIWRAESERFASRALHQEMFSAIRFDLGWGQSAEQGLPPGSLEIESLLRPGFRLLSNWKIARLASMLGGHRLIGLRAGWLPARSAPDLGVIYTRECSEAGLLEAGGRFQEVWLALTRDGLSVQPLAASALFTLPGWIGVREGCADYLRAGWAELLAPQLQPVMVFRAGRASPPLVRTSRPSPSAVLVME